MAEAPRFNLRNPAVKRIMQEIREIKQDTSGDFLAEALETDIFEWHFVIRGPQDTEFDGGIYHGRILLPAEYPFKPPSFMMLTPNGRFETNMKICLSISSHHPEHWQPSWSVRTALMALIAFMPSPGAGALGALDFSKDERRVLAARSRTEIPRFGSVERQRVIDEMHSRMLSIAAAKEAERQAAKDTRERGDAAAQQQQLQQQADSSSQTGTSALEKLPSLAPAQPQSAAQETGEQKAADARGAAGAGGSSSAGAAAPSPRGLDAAPSAAALAASSTTPVPALSPSPSQQRVIPEAQPPTRLAAASPSPAKPAAPAGAAPSPPARANAAGAARWDAAAAARADGAAAAAANGGAGAAAGITTSTDHMLTALMWALYVGIGAILLRKVMGVMGVDLAELLQ